MSKIDICEIGYDTPKILLYILTFHKNFLFQLIFGEDTPGTVLGDFFQGCLFTTPYLRHFAQFFNKKNYKVSLKCIFLTKKNHNSITPTVSKKKNSRKLPFFWPPSCICPLNIDTCKNLSFLYIYNVFF